MPEMSWPVSRNPKARPSYRVSVNYFLSSVSSENTHSNLANDIQGIEVKPLRNVKCLLRSRKKLHFLTEVGCDPIHVVLHTKNNTHLVYCGNLSATLAMSRGTAFREEVEIMSR